MRQFDDHEAFYAASLNQNSKRIANKRVTRQNALADAAFVADQVEFTARPGDGKDAAAEIGRRIRALMEGGR